MIDGNIFIYFDGAHLYHLPADKVRIETDPNTFVSKYTYENSLDYSPSEIIHIKENSFQNILLLLKVKITMLQLLPSFIF